MARRNPDTDYDYLYISTRLKVREQSLLTHAQYSRIITAKSDEEVVKLLSETGWEQFDPRDSISVEKQIEKQREDTFAFLKRFIPDVDVLDVFRLKYDYHNLKVLGKSMALGMDFNNLMSNSGTVPADELARMWHESDLESLPEHMRKAAEGYKKILSDTDDPQLADIFVDKCMAEHMASLAEESGSEFLQGYVKLYIDGANLRIAVRAVKAGKGEEFVKNSWLPGSSVQVNDKYEDDLVEHLIDQLCRGSMSSAKSAVAAALEQGGSMAALDKACDDVLIAYARTSRRLSFGAAQVISYVVAKESQLVALRIILAIRAAGFSAEQLTEILWLSYV